MSFVVSDVSNAIDEAHEAGLYVNTRKEKNGDLYISVWDEYGNRYSGWIDSIELMTARNTDFIVACQIRKGIKAVKEAPQESLQEYLDRMDGYDIDRECGDR